MMTVNEAAAMLRVSAKFVYSLCSKGLLESFKIGGRIRISATAIDEYLAKCKRGEQPTVTTPPQRRLTLSRLKLR